MTSEQKQIILATVPILRESGLALTTHFYKRMFEHNPELKNLFNMGNQKQGKQQNALAFAVLAYAENIANPAVLLPVVDRIGHKHTSLDIKPEQYLIVGEHLIASISELLGDTATPPILDAWTAAYSQLAALMAGHEATIYQQQLNKVNGWNSWRKFTVRKKVAESAEISSFYFYPSDNGKVSVHKPGQFISLKTFLPSLNLDQIRQYSISCAPNEDYYRISVKRETGADINANGMISNHLHDHIGIGSEVELTAPAGNFVVPEELDSPIMFISGGVGQTPFISMIQHMAKKQTGHPVTWLHGCRNRSVHAFKDSIDLLVNNHKTIEQHIFYDHTTAEDANSGVRTGFLDIASIANLEHTGNTLYYVCGPSPFIIKQVADLKQMGVDNERILFEEFGPQTLQLN
ncbi:MAG: NO-inducible flavohemoprotein [Bacteroidota bacterium]